jgi:DNA-binding LacI/PurR family transcriptional regulator
METMTPEMAVSLEMIAERLNLSRATVSRALRNLPGTHPRTRSLVMNTAAEMGYRPQRTRERQASEGHKLIGVLVRSSSRQWRSLAFLEGMAAVSNSLDVSLDLHHVGLSQAEDILNPRKQSPAMRAGSYAGLVLVHRWPEPVVRYLAQRFVCVSMVHSVRDTPLDVIDMDHNSGVLQLMRHLVERGHHRIGFLGRNPELGWAKSRYASFIKALYELELPHKPQWVVDVPTPLLEDSSWVWDQITDQVCTQIDAGVRAWMASSDFAGYSLWRGLAERGIRVPEDVAITGFDNDEQNTFGLPPLTSVMVPKQKMGDEALRRVLRRVNEPDAPQHTSLFGCTLTLGGSTPK